MPNCSVCINKLTAKATVVCPVASCEYVACKTCVQTYLLNTHLEAHCMNCRNKWNLDFVKKSLGNTFLTTDYRSHRVKLLADKVIAKKEEYLENASLYKTLLENKNTLQTLNAEVSEIRRLYEAKYRELETLRTIVASGTATLLNKQPGQRIQRFTMPCQNSDCRGMLDSSYFCLLCAKKTCKDCLTIIEPEHVCNPDTVASAALIKSSSKPCPKCGTRISKIDGCDQMWCVECKTAFSWNTGAIETGVLHNPHYYEWMRTRTAEQPEIAACNGHLDINVLNTVFNRVYNIYSGYTAALKCLPNHELIGNISAILEPHISLFEEFYNAYYTLTEYDGYANHIAEVLIPEANTTLEQKINNNNNIYEYLIGNITREELGSTLVTKENTEAYLRAGNDIVNATQMVLTQILQTLMQSLTNIINDTTHPIHSINKQRYIIESGATRYTYHTGTNSANNSAIILLHGHIKDGKINTYLSVMQLLLNVFNEHINNANKYLAYSNIEQIKTLIMYNTKRSICVWDFAKRKRVSIGNLTKGDMKVMIETYKEYL